MNEVPPQVCEIMSCVCYAVWVPNERERVREGEPERVSKRESERERERECKRVRESERVSRRE